MRQNCPDDNQSTTRAITATRTMAQADHIPAPRPRSHIHLLAQISMAPAVEPITHPGNSINNSNTAGSPRSNLSKATTPSSLNLLMDNSHNQATEDSPTPHTTSTLRASLPMEANSKGVVTVRIRHLSLHHQVRSCIASTSNIVSTNNSSSNKGGIIRNTNRGDTILSSNTAATISSNTRRHPQRVHIPALRVNTAEASSHHHQAIIHPVTARINKEDTEGSMVAARISRVNTVGTDSSREATTEGSNRHILRTIRRGTDLGDWFL